MGGLLLARFGSKSKGNNNNTDNNIIKDLNPQDPGGDNSTPGTYPEIEEPLIPQSGGGASIILEDWLKDMQQHKFQPVQPDFPNTEKKFYQLFPDSNYVLTRAGIGRVSFYKAMSQAQKQGVEFGKKPEELTEKEKRILQQVGEKNRYKQSRASVSKGNTYASAFYTFLNNKYKQIAGIGSVVYPHQEYVVTNSKGQPAIIFYEYDRDADMKAAIDMFTSISDAEQKAYFETLAFIYSDRRQVRMGR